MFGATAPSTEPSVTKPISAASAPRPEMSDSRGRNTPNSAPEVKNAVYDRPVATSSVCGSRAMVGSTALIMLAPSWKATHAASCALMALPSFRTVDPGRERFARLSLED